MPAVQDFADRWVRLAAHWHGLEATDPVAADALVVRALEVGLVAAAVDLPSPEREPSGPDVRRCEIAVVRRSGAIDDAGYLAHNPKMAAAGKDPATNYCRTGWRKMRNPSLAFDGWWYRSEYLSSTADGVDATVNPLLHWLLVGRFHGWLPLPERPSLRALPPLDTDGRRAILFAAYDPDGLVDDYVVDHVRDLARFGDVFVLYDGALRPGQLARLDGLAAGAWVEQHGSYDFGSWARLARDRVGWPTLEHYDTVLLVNDSCYPLRPLDGVFAAMAGRPADFWGLQLTARRFEPGPAEPQRLAPAEVERDWLPRAVWRYEEFAHVGSYFLALRRSAYADPGWRRRLDAARHVAAGDRQLLVHQYETGTTQYLVGQGHRFATYVEGLRPFHPIYGPGYFDLVAEGFPLLKRRFLVANPFHTPGLDRWRERLLAAAPDLDPRRLDVARANLDRLARSARVE